MQVRRLICACLVQLYLVGDTLPLYSRVASLQSYLGSKVCHSPITQPQHCIVMCSPDSLGNVSSLPLGLDCSTTPRLPCPDMPVYDLTWRG